MNIMEVMELPVGTIVTNSKGEEYEIERIVGGKYFKNKSCGYTVTISDYVTKEEYSIVKEFKKGDKVYIDWFYDTEGLDEVEFLCYCADGIFAQVLIETEEKYLLKEVKIKNIFKHK